MRWLNYHHLYYFWMVAKRGTVSEACRELKLAQPTVSAQLKSLEEVLGEKLFEKEGRYLKLTESGQLAFRYAEQIFGLGDELFDLLEGKSVGRAELLRVGIVDAMPKMLVHQLVDPVLDLDPAPRIVCHEGSAEKLLADLAIHELDLVLSDCPIPTSARVRAYNHELCSSTISFMAASELVRGKLKFPHCLEDLPLLLPSTSASIRQALDQWFESQSIRPRSVAEFQDTALMKIFGRSGRGVFPIPSIIEDEVAKDLNVKLVGRVPSIVERFYLISLERKIKHPAVAKICSVAHALAKR